MSAFTADEVEALLLACIKAGDIPGVGTCLMALAGIDPERADLLYIALELGVLTADPAPVVPSDGSGQR